MEMKWKEPTLKELENLCCHRVSLALLKACYDGVPEGRLRRLLKLANVHALARKSWDRDTWWDEILEPKKAPHNNAIIRTYEHHLCRLQETTKDQRCVEREAAIATIDQYLTSCRDGVYEADGVYAVIHQHRQGSSAKHYCDICKNNYWAFAPDTPCPDCLPWHVQECVSCGSVFLRRLDGGRPRIHCPECRSIKKSTAGAKISRNVNKKVRRPKTG